MEGCEGVWKDGYWVDTEFDVTKYADSIACFDFGKKLKWEDGAVPVALLPPEDPIALRNYISSIPILNRISTDGVYIWLLYSLKDSPETIRFAACFVDTPFEVGTKHGSIALRMRAEKVHGAGELKKTGNEIWFNLESGTYTKSWIESRTKKRTCSADELTETVIGEMKKRFPDAVYTSKPLIPAVPFTKAKLDMYVAAGFRLKIIPPELVGKIGQCVMFVHPRA